MQILRQCGLGIGAIAMGWFLGKWSAGGPVKGHPVVPVLVEKSGVRLAESPGDGAALKADGFEGSAQLATIGADADGREAQVAKALRITDRIRRTHDLWDVVGRMDASEIPGAIERSRELRPKDRDQFLPMLVARWAELNPKAAAEFATGLSKADSRHNAMSVAMEIWMSQDAALAQAWAASLPDAKDRSDAQHQVGLTIAKMDPVKALDFMAKLTPDHFGEDEYTWIFEQWGRRDPSGAAAHALMLPPSAVKVRMIDVTARAWAEVDPMAALAWAKDNPDLDQRNSGVDAVLRTWARSHPVEASAYLEGLPAGNEKDRLIGAALQQMAWGDLDSARRLLDLMPPGSARDGAAQIVIINWARQDPVAAVQYAAALPTGSGQNKAFGRAIHEWALRDHVAAFDWATKLTDDNQRNTAIREIMDQRIQTDPREAANYLVKQMNEPDKGMLDNLAMYWVQKDPKGALDWVTALSNEKIRNAAMPEFLGRLAAIDPAQAAERCAELSPEVQKKAAGQVARVWVEFDPNRAASWVLGFPEGPVRTAVTQGLADTWAYHDPTSAARWLQSLTPGSERDSAISRFVPHISGSDPESAAAWAESMSDSKARQAAIEKVMKRWLDDDPKAARAWIEGSSTLDMETKHRVMGTP